MELALPSRRPIHQSFAAMTAQERARLIAMYGVIASLHVAGFVICSRSWCPRITRGSGWG
jgi:hypothetical protein